MKIFEIIFSKSKIIRQKYRNQFPRLIDFNRIIVEVYFLQHDIYLQMYLKCKIFL